MKIAVLRFPGSNCDQDAFHALNDDLGIRAEYVWHEATSLQGFDGVFIPGGFSYGDYLRCGAMASRAPVMEEVRRFAAEGRPILGACNGFQILCEANLLEGALLLNEGQKFVHEMVELTAVNRTSIWTVGSNRPVRMPIAHGEGRFVCEPDVLKRLADDDRIAFRYSSPNPNGSQDDVAGIVGPGRNVLGLMPHPERATRRSLGSDDGKLILQGFAALVAA